MADLSTALYALLRSRKFLVMLLDFLVSTILYFSVKYLNPSLSDDVKFLIGGQSLIAMAVIIGITVEDSAAKIAGKWTPTAPPTAGATGIAFTDRAGDSSAPPFGRIATMFILAALLALSLLMLSVPAPAFADSPQPYTYALVKCSGLPVDILVLAQQDFDTAYGWSHQLTTPAQWSGSYEARVNEFASLLGCPQVLQDGQPNRWFKFYSPTYQHILRDLAR